MWRIVLPAADRFFLTAETVKSYLWDANTLVSLNRMVNCCKDVNLR